jgi:hypothetical protein
MKKSNINYIIFTFFITFFNNKMFKADKKFKSINNWGQREYDV